jgi:hypothetical protein
MHGCVSHLPPFQLVISSRTPDSMLDDIFRCKRELVVWNARVKMAYSGDHHYASSHQSLILSITDPASIIRERDVPMLALGLRMNACAICRKRGWSFVLLAT